MISSRMLFAVLVLAGSVAGVQGAYVAETGRTETREAPTAEAMGRLADGATTSAAGGHVHEEAAPAATASVALADLYDAAVEKALAGSGVPELAVQSEGVNTSIRTFAEVQVQQIAGQTRLKMADGRRMDPVYTVLGMIYQQKAWMYAPILPVEDAGLAARFGLDPKAHNRVSPAWVMKTPAVRTLVMPILMGGGAAPNALSEDEQKALDKFAFRLGSFLNIPSEFKLVPAMGEVKGEWLSPSHMNRPDTINDKDLQAQIAALDKGAAPYAEMLALDAALRQAYDRHDAAGLAGAADAFLKSVDNAPEYMPPFVRKLDYWNTAIHPFQKASLLSMLSFFAFVAYFMTVRRKRRGGGTTGSAQDQADGGGRAVEERPAGLLPGAEQISAAFGGQLNPALAMGGAAGAMPARFESVPDEAVLRRPGTASGGSGYGDPALQAELEVPIGARSLWKAAYALLILAAVTIVGGIVARFVIGGRMPVSNMYESIIFAMGAFAVVSVVFEGVFRRGWVGAGCAFAGWVLMTAANSMPIHMKKVEPLVAVLKSIWLNFHVTSLLISYSAFLLAFVCGVLYFIKDLTGNRPGALPRKEMFEYISYRAVQVGWPLLTLGVFLGAVWANTAWGSYWSWDPKETWALITWFTYTIYLHLRMNLGWSNRRAVIANMVGFAMVLITYFGVSYLPGLSGGMHSYAEPISK